jgi:hypothetical protein
MATSEAKIWMAMKGHSDKVLTALDYAINWPLEAFVPPQDANAQLPYAEVRHLPAGVGWRPIASKGKHMKIGILQITLLWPAGQVGAEVHPDNLVERAGAIAAAFKTDLKMRYLDVAVRVEQAPNIAQPFRDGAYWRIPVSINYSCFTT